MCLKTPCTILNTNKFLLLLYNPYFCHPKKTDQFFVGLSGLRVEMHTQIQRYKPLNDYCGSSSFGRASRHLRDQGRGGRF